MTLSRFQQYYGTDTPPVAPLALRAGALALDWDGTQLRYIRAEGIEAVRGVYCAVRDRQWNTLAPSITDFEQQVGADSFMIRYTAEHVSGAMRYRWQATISGTPDSRIVYRMEGEALTDFERNRIGFCILHPAALAGQPVSVTHIDGSIEETSFPRAIAPYQPFIDIRMLEHTLRPRVRVQVAFEGETFETEDQRQWSDASFKTYGTPLTLPFPVTLPAGTRLSQAVTIQLVGDAQPVRIEADDAVTLDIDRNRIFNLPALGLVASTDEANPLTEREAGRLRALQLDHLRADLVLSRPENEVRSALVAAQAEAEVIGARLHLAVFVGEDAQRELEVLRALIDELKPPLDLCFFFNAKTYSTPPDLIRLARRILGNLSLGGGTDSFFTDLNRSRPELTGAAAAGFCITPQVHATDNATLVETLPMYAENVRGARALYPEQRIAAGPITLKMRYNPAAGGAFAMIPGQLPPSVDPRQMSLFGAAWTLGSIKYLAEGGADAATFFGTRGWHGVLESEQGSPLPEQFPSLPASVFPLWHVFRAVAGARGAQVLQTVSSAPLKVEGLALRSASVLRVLLANFTAATVRVRLPDLSRHGMLFTLDERTAMAAMQAPEQIGQTPIDLAPDASLTLAPFAFVHLTLPEETTP